MVQRESGGEDLKGICAMALISFVRRRGEEGRWAKGASWCIRAGRGATQCNGRRSAREGETGRGRRKANAIKSARNMRESKKNKNHMPTPPPAAYRVCRRVCGLTREERNTVHHHIPLPHCPVSTSSCSSALSTTLRVVRGRAVKKKRCFF